jgi:ABC-type glycerol-3-phosphate transport system substrate-binding protein
VAGRWDGAIETIIKRQMEAGSTPDVAFVPQPGLFARPGQKGTLMLVPDDIAALYDTNITPAWKTPVIIN